MLFGVCFPYEANGSLALWMYPRTDRRFAVQPAFLGRLYDRYVFRAAFFFWGIAAGTEAKDRNCGVFHWKLNQEINNKHYSQ